MEVILQENYPSLGYVGDRVNVRRGFARNFLIPRGMAVEVGSRNAKLLQHKLSGINAKKAKLKLEAEKLASDLSQVALDFVMKLGTQGKSFGAVTLRDVELALEQKSFKLERRQLRLSEAIKAPGNYELHVKLHSEVSLSLPIKVSAEKAAVSSEERKEKGRGRGRGRSKADQETTAPESEEVQAAADASDSNQD